MIEVTWKNDEKTIIQLDYSNPINSWEEYQAAIDDAHRLAQSVKHSVMLLHNPNTTPMPAGNPIVQLRRAVAKTPDNVICIVMVITNRLARRMVDIALYIFNYPTHYKMVESLAEAEDYLASFEASS